MALVTVALAVYNGADLLPDALRSVRAQGFSDCEILVVDDGSADDSASIAESFGARVIRQANAGLGAARRVLVEEAGGELIAFIDHDDRWEPNKLEVQVPAHLASGCVLSHTSGWNEYPDGRVVERRVPPAEDPYDQLLPDGPLIIASSAVFSRQAMLDAGNFREDVRLASDWYGWMLLASRGNFLTIDEPLARYRFREGQNTSLGKRWFLGEQYLVQDVFLADWDRFTPGMSPERRRTLERMLIKKLARIKRHLAHHAKADGERREALSYHKASVRLDPGNVGYWLSYLKTLAGR